jgi:hypothetical protein
MWIGRKEPADWVVMGTEAFCLLICAYRITKKQFSWGEALLFLGILAGLAYWFISAPGVRFVVCYLVPLLFLATKSSVPSISNPSAQKAAPILSIALALFFLAICRDTRVLRNHLLTPAPWPQIQVRPSQNGPYVYPASVYADGSLGMCWDAPLPCADNGDHKIKLRGKTLQNGFEPAKKENIHEKVGADCISPKRHHCKGTNMR